MKQTIVGVYSMGLSQVQIVLREGNGGEFYFNPEAGAVPRIKVGAELQWAEVVGNLLHEALEMQMTALSCRFNPAPDYARDHSSYLFVMTHPQFSESCARTAEFITAALPDLARAWKKWKR